MKDPRGEKAVTTSAGGEGTPSSGEERTARREHRLPDIQFGDQQGQHVGGRRAVAGAGSKGGNPHEDSGDKTPGQEKEAGAPTAQIEGDRSDATASRRAGSAEPVNESVANGRTPNNDDMEIEDQGSRTTSNGESSIAPGDGGAVNQVPVEINF